MKSLRLSLLFVAFIAISTSCLTAAQLATAKALGITGSVTKLTANGSSPLMAGDILKQGDSISVTALSSAQLVFSNGSKIDLKENTNLTIAEFAQDQFGGNATYEQLEADPSKSQVLLELNYGELDGHVKKLQQGSKFDIQTPIGTASIRGTQFTVSLRYNATNSEFTLEVLNKDGKVNMISGYAGSSALQDVTEEPLPINQTAVIRLNKRDPLFDELFSTILNYIPEEDRPDPSDDDTIIINIITPEDPGTQVVSPNTEVQP